MAATAASLAVVLPALPAAAVLTLPQGFLLQDIPTGLQSSDPLTDFGYLPDESLLIIAKNGKVMWAPQGGTPRQLAMLPVNQVGDLGLIGLAIAPDYAASRTVYTTRSLPIGTPGGGANGLFRLSKWTVSVDGTGNPTGLTNEVAVVEATADGDSHGMWAVIAAPDGTIWVSIGDSADYHRVDPAALRALDPNDIHGKILHVLPDGSGVPANPYYNAADPRSVPSRVYASGVRSPFRMVLDTASGRPILGDVGWYSTEEIDILNPGNSYGWPCWEGNAPTPGYKDLAECAGQSTASPLWSYPHNAARGAVTGGVVYTGTAYPEQYRGRYFFGDYVFNKIYTLRMNERGELVTPPETDGFGSEIGWPVKFATVPTGGDIVYADIATGKIRRLVYAPGNNPPQAVITSTIDPATRTLTFDATDSFDPNGDPLTYLWDFGDGTPPAPGPAVISHTYAADPDHFTATVTVTDPLSATGTATATVYPSNHAPVLNVNAPRDGTTFAVGDTVTATASATDAEDGPLQVSWAVTLVHCTAIGVCHLHPGDQQSGPNFSMLFNGHPGDSRLEVAVSATDSRGAATEETFVVQPKQRRVTVHSNSPAAFTLGEEQTTTALFTVGMRVSIVAPENAQDGVASFDRWADGSTSRIRELTMPDADQALSAAYSTPIDRRYASDAGLRTLVGTPVNVEQGDGTGRFREYTGGRISWSPGSGIHYVVNGILARYASYGYERSGFGYPTTDEISRDNIGTFNHFQGGSIYWNPNTGVHHVVNGIRAKYASYDYELSFLGYPTTDETSRDNIGTFNHFQGGSIYWSPGSGIHYVVNGIRAVYGSYGYERSFFGYPTTDEMSRDNIGTFNHFQGGSIYWSPGSGLHFVINGIRAHYLALNAELSYLGYPVSNEYAIPGGARTDFQFGFITWSASTGQIIDRRY